MQDVPMQRGQRDPSSSRQLPGGGFIPVLMIEEETLFVDGNLAAAGDHLRNLIGACSHALLIQKRLSPALNYRQARSIGVNAGLSAGLDNATDGVRQSVCPSISASPGSPPSPQPSPLGERESPAVAAASLSPWGERQSEQGGLSCFHSYRTGAKPLCAPIGHGGPASHGILV